jgi:LCP family protein required for cell wall assembly
MAGTGTKLRRTWPQRLVLAMNSLLVVACLAGAGVVWYSNNRLGALERVTIQHTDLVDVIAAGGSPGTTALPSGAEEPDVAARNFLLVGSDTRQCGDPASPDGGAILDEGDLGERSDTLMVIRVDPDQEQAAILSFPRDLWVSIAGTNRRGRINSAYDRDNPSKLVQTIEENFGVPIDHYIEVDFCAFQNLVDAVGGVRVPFEYPTRDRYTGLDIPEPGCVLFDGAEALAYVRSRHYQYYDGERWREDIASDFGRISRQQDFIRRSLQRAIDRGARNPNVAKQLLDTGLRNVRVDQNLTISDLVQLATRLRGFDPARVRTYRVDGTGTIIGGAMVLLPDTKSRFATTLFKVFRGEARLGELDDQVFETATRPATTIRTATTAAPSIPGAPLPTVTIAENTAGIFPPDDPTCR